MGSLSLQNMGPYSNKPMKKDTQSAPGCFRRTSAPSRICGLAERSNCELIEGAFVHEKSFACPLGEGAVPNISFT